MLPLCPLDAGSTRSRPRLELCQFASPAPLVGLYLLTSIKKTTVPNEPSRCGLFSGGFLFLFFIFYFFIFLFFYFFIFFFIFFLFYYFFIFYFYFFIFIFYFLFFIFSFFIFSFFLFFIFSFFLFFIFSFFYFLFFHFFIFLFFIFLMTSSPTYPSPLSFFPSPTHPSLFFPPCLADAFRRFSEDSRSFSEDDVIFGNLGLI